VIIRILTHGTIQRWNHAVPLISAVMDDHDGIDACVGAGAIYGEDWDIVRHRRV
jgi:hypothetical protein